MREREYKEQSKVKEREGDSVNDNKSVGGPQYPKQIENEPATAEARESYVRALDCKLELRRCGDWSVRLSIR